MRYDPDKHDRRSIRLPEYDYAKPGAYFITICTHNRTCLFGAVIDGRMRLNPFGRVVADEWRRTERLRDNVALDAFVVMPNHVHGIIGITHRSNRRRGVSQHDPTNELRTPSQTSAPSSADSKAPPPAASIAYGERPANRSGNAIITNTSCAAGATSNASDGTSARTRPAGIGTAIIRIVSRETFHAAGAVHPGLIPKISEKRPFKLA